MAKEGRGWIGFSRRRSDSWTRITRPPRPGYSACSGNCISGVGRIPASHMGTCGTGLQTPGTSGTRGRRWRVIAVIGRQASTGGRWDASGRHGGPTPSSKASARSFVAGTTGLLHVVGNGSRSPENQGSSVPWASPPSRTVWSSAQSSKYSNPSSKRARGMSRTGFVPVEAATGRWSTSA